MVGLFLIFLISLILIVWNKRNLVFGLVILNLILGLLMLLHHSTDVINIRL